MITEGTISEQAVMDDHRGYYIRTGITVKSCNLRMLFTYNKKVTCISVSCDKSLIFFIYFMQILRVPGTLFNTQSRTNVTRRHIIQKYINI